MRQTVGVADMVEKAERWLAVDERAVERARRWLVRHGLGGVRPTRLLAARLRARDRITRRVLALAVVVAATMVVVSFRWTSSTVGQPVHGVRFMVTIVAVSVLMLCGVWWVLRGPRGVERKIADAMVRRVTHPDAPDWRDVVGRWHAAAAAVLYTCALVFGTCLAIFANLAQFRTVAVIFLVGVVGCAGLVWASLVDVMRRPVLADDEVSLAADDLLRVIDARRALGPFPVVFVVPVTTIVGSPGRWWIFLCAVAIAWIGGWVAETVEPTPGRSATAKRAMAAQ